MNLETLSREDLVAEMLGTANDLPSPLHVSDIEAIRPDASWPERPLSRRLDIARALLLRDLRAQMTQGPVMSSPQVLRDWLCQYCAGLEHEVFLVLYLNINHRLIEAQELFRGTLTQTSVYPRELVKAALARNAAAVVVAHNHPSGVPEPSRADEFLTQSLKSKCQAWHLALNDKEPVMRSIVAKR